MFENLKNFGALIKQAQQLSGRMQQMSTELRGKRVEGTAGGGLVTVEANGLGEVLSCRIDPSLLEKGERELIEDLLPAAFNQAIARARQLHAESLRSLGQGDDMPGLGEMLSQLSGGDPSGPNP